MQQTNKVQKRYLDIYAVEYVANFFRASGYTDVTNADAYYSEKHGFVTDCKCPWDLEVTHPTNGKHYVVEVKRRETINGNPIYFNSTPDVYIDAFKMQLIQSAITNGYWLQWDKNPKQADKTKVPNMYGTNYAHTPIIAHYYPADGTIGIGYVTNADMESTKEMPVPWQTYCNRGDEYQGRTKKQMIFPRKQYTVQMATTYTILQKNENNELKTINEYDAKRFFPNIVQ